jgi:hypothetical protein
MAKKKNTLTRAEQRKLEDLLIAKKAEIAEGKWKLEELALLATERMKRNVTVGNVSAAAKAVDIPFSAKQSKEMDRVSALVSRVDQLESRLSMHEAEYPIDPVEIGDDPEFDVKDPLPPLPSDLPLYTQDDDEGVEHLADRPKLTIGSLSTSPKEGTMPVDENSNRPAV